MKNLAIVSIVTLVLAFALGVYATTLDYTWNPQAGDAILSADVRQDHAEAESAVNNIDSTNISDSSITYAEMGANSVNATHLAPGAVRAVHIDSGAIMFDTQIAFNAISTSKLVSTTDTVSNWTQTWHGMFRGDGTDSRIIWTTFADTPAGNGYGGEWIGINITRLEVINATANGAVFVVTDAFDDTGSLNYTAASHAFWFATVGLPHFGNGYANGTDYTLQPAFTNSGDSHGFIVNAESFGGGASNFNIAGDPYYWTAWGY